MGKETGISWTDHTFNPWWGCVRVSPGCVNCYAETFAKRTGHDVWGPTASYRTFAGKHWCEPLNWDAAAFRAGVKAKVFCASMADVFDERAPESEREKLWKLIHETPNLIWQILTKRPENWRLMLPDNIPPNIWLGFSVEDQDYFDKRARYMGELLDFAGPYFVSYEPALGPVRIEQCDARLRWLIFGGESGPKRRPMEEQWARDIKADCERHHIAFFMKQMSARMPAEGAKLIPADLLVRNFPSLGDSVKGKA